MPSIEQAISNHSGVPLVSIDCRRRAFTLIELLVCLLIIAVLIALVLPAVQYARESARRTVCLGNLRQLAIAARGYLQTHHTLPRLTHPVIVDLRHPEILEKSKRQQFSGLVPLLPYLDQGVLFNQINFESGMSDIYLYGDWEGFVDNSTAAATSLQVFLCPSDGGGASASRTAPTNYRISNGTDAFMGHTTESGPFGLPESAVPDGLGNTAFFSEKVIGALDAGSAPRSAHFYLNLYGNADDPPAVRQASCATHEPADPTIFTTGLSWITSGNQQTYYNHIMGPQSEHLDCGNRSRPITGAFAARSRHSDLVHIALGDGACKAIRKSIDVEVWRALGTRASGEIVSGDH
jgi:prepilin-type N-terminal cleavage/methylation domain-containing protein